MLKDTKPVKFYREKAEALLAECRGLRKKVAEHDALVASLRGDFGAAVDSLAKMADEVTQARTSQAAAEEKCAGLNRGVEALQAKLKAAKAEAEDRAINLDIMTDRYRDAYQAMEDRGAKVEKLAKRITELEADDRDLAALRRRLAGKQSEIEKLTAEVHRLKAAYRAQGAGLDVIMTTRTDEMNARALIASAKPDEDASTAG